MSDHIAMVGVNQGTFGLLVANIRGRIYDRNFTPMVNNQYIYIASVLPTPQAATALLGQATDDYEREVLTQRLGQVRPFVTPVNTIDIYAAGIDVFRIPQRYGNVQLAPHLVGHLSGDERVGAMGIELAFNDWLNQTGGSITTIYRVDATGRTMRDGAVGVERENPTARGGVVLTIDSRYQQLAQDALIMSGVNGAAVVMDISTGNILAMSSIPAFDQNDIVSSLGSEESPFINRAISGFNVGSAFKLVVSAAALEENIPVTFTYECGGRIDVGGQIFRCNNNAVHGETDMRRALAVSCNTYFIYLAQQISQDSLVRVSQNLGFGLPSVLAPGMNSQPGNLPNLAELHVPAALANFSFGQGTLMASPLQMARAMTAMAGGGAMVHPRLVEGLTEDGETFAERFPIYAANQVLSNRTAEILHYLMIDTVENGSGRPARPTTGGAGGKTSSAQTGQFAQDDEGNEHEVVHAWFAGFYPAERPRYSIVVFVEGGLSGERVAAPIFRAIADGIPSQ